MNIVEETWLKLPPRFRAKVERGDCWTWTAAVNSRGYGSLTNGQGSSQLAHRYAYELTRELIPDGLTIDHLCRNKRCVNPDHLEVVTRRENSSRAARSITHCKHGHPLSGDNLNIRKRSDGSTQRECLICRRAMQRRYYAKHLKKGLAA